MKSSPVEPAFQNCSLPFLRLMQAQQLPAVSVVLEKRSPQVPPGWKTSLVLGLRGDQAFKPIEKVNSPRDSPPNRWNERLQTSNNHTIVANATEQSLFGLENEPHCSTSQQST